MDVDYDFDEIIYMSKW